MSGHAPDCTTPTRPVVECDNCRPWEPEDGPYWDALSGWFDRPGGKRYACSCSVGPTRPPEQHSRLCRFEGPIVPMGRGRSYPRAEPLHPLRERMVGPKEGA